MEFTRRILQTVLFWLTLTVFIVDSTEISNLRHARSCGTNGRFVVPRRFLEEELEKLGLNGRVQLLSSTKYNSDCEGELALFIQTSEDLTLLSELTPELREKVTSDGISVIITLPVVASDGAHLIIVLARFSDVPRPFVYPYLTSVPAVRHVDSIEVGDCFVTLKDGADVMHIVIDHDEGCHDDADVGEDFDYVTGKDVRLSDFPAAFDWRCDILGRDVSFCKTLEPFMDEINDADGDVCIEMVPSKSRRCSADMSIVSMTGVFSEAAPFFAEMVPVQSFEAEWIDREHDVRIVFPCF